MSTVKNEKKIIIQINFIINNLYNNMKGKKEKNIQ